MLVNLGRLYQVDVLPQILGYVVPDGLLQLQLQLWTHTVKAGASSVGETKLTIRGCVLTPGIIVFHPLSPPASAASLAYMWHVIQDKDDNDYSFFFDYKWAYLMP